MKISIRLAIAAVIGAVVLSGALLVTTSRPGFCRSCHEMRDDYRAWRASAHKEVSCVSCHIEPGAVNFLTHKVSALKEVSAHIAGGYEAPINENSKVSQKLPSASCIACHKSPGKK